MNNNQSQRLFFIELCITFIFFLMIAVTCFLSFTKSKLIQINANKQIQYADITENITETILSATDTETASKKLQTEFNGITITNDLLTYETNGLITVIDIADTDSFMQATITIYETNNPVYQITIKKALGEQT